MKLRCYGLHTRTLDGIDKAQYDRAAAEEGKESTLDSASKVKRSRRQRRCRRIPPPRQDENKNYDATSKFGLVILPYLLIPDNKVGTSSLLTRVRCMLMVGIGSEVPSQGNEKCDK